MGMAASLSLEAEACLVQLLKVIRWLNLVECDCEAVVHRAVPRVERLSYKVAAQPA